MQQVIYWQKEIQALPVYMITIGIGCGDDLNSISWYQSYSRYLCGEKET